MKPDQALVITIKERCRTCYTCVRECPAKAIRIADGQAEVVAARCIGCGNCVRVCSQEAKQVLDGIPAVEELLDGSERVVACLAPSFPAEFPEMNPAVLVGLVRAAGFDSVHEVGFGADLVARATARLMEDRHEGRWVASSCPAIVGFVERYHPDIVDSLLPLVSPMVATAQALRRLRGPELKVVFIGPCIAKKSEIPGEVPHREIEAVLTFAELRELLDRRGLRPEQVIPADFDPPHANLGAVFPISRGLVETAGLKDDLVSSEVVTADGRQNFPEAIREFEMGDMDARLLDVLCCEGCIMGAGMSRETPLFRRRAQVSRYARERTAELDRQAWESDMEACRGLDLDRRFEVRDQRLNLPDEEQIRAILLRLGKERPEDELNCRACGYDTCRQHAEAIFKGLAESEMCLPYVIEQLKQTVGELNVSHAELASTQEQLMHSERLASMGQLAAGIAHEVNNPLGVVLLYTHMLKDEIGEDGELSEELSLIAEQADRCKTIVSGLLKFARQNKVNLQPVRLSRLVEQSLRSCSVPEKVRLRVEHQDPGLEAELDGDQIVQVLTNLVSNALAAMPMGGGLRLGTRAEGEDVVFEVADTGTGISPEILAKIFEPFFTTKQMGMGTGLGLAVSYGIVKMHRGRIKVESNDDLMKGPTGTIFTVTLPRRGPAESLATLGASEDRGESHD